MPIVIVVFFQVRGAARDLIDHVAAGGDVGAAVAVNDGVVGSEGGADKGCDDSERSGGRELHFCGVAIDREKGLNVCI